MSIAVYFGETPLYLCTKNDLGKLSSQKDITVIETEAYQDKDWITLVQSQIKNPKKIALVGPSTEELWDKLSSYFTIIEAAGGIVLNDNKELLFIFRRGKWDLPKGKMEENESAEIAAAREVEEETHIDQLQLIHKVGCTYHYYQERGKDVLKISHWFYFTTSATGSGKPQTEEDITDVKWIATKDIKTPMKNTYQTIKDILTNFFDQP